MFTTEYATYCRDEQFSFCDQELFTSLVSNLDVSLSNAAI